VDGCRGRGVRAEVGQCGGVAVHEHLSSAEGWGLDAGITAGGHVGELDMVLGVPAVSTDGLSGDARCGCQLEPPLSLRRYETAEGES
jgi:hypothetical protein